MLCLEFVKDKKTKEPMPGNWNFGNRIINETMPRGLLARPMGHLVVLSPPLIISKAQIDEAAEAMRGAIKAVTDSLMRDGLWQEKAA